MSLPSYAVFKKGDEEVKRVFINCGWFHDGQKTTIRMIKEMYMDEWGSKKYPDEQRSSLIPEDYDTVQIYDETLMKEEVDFIVEQLIKNDLMNEDL